MSSSDTARAENADQDHLSLFTGCHARIRETIERMRQIPAMIDRGAQREAAETAQDVVRFFENTVLSHHRDEERVLWPMLGKCAPDAQEHETVHAVAARLKREHEEMEALWSRVERGLRDVARGKPASLDASGLAELSNRYDAHADYEDAVVVPMARFLLDPTEQHRMAIQVAIQHLPVRGYI